MLVHSLLYAFLYSLFLSSIMYTYILYLSVCTWCVPCFNKIFMSKLLSISLLLSNISPTSFFLDKYFHISLVFSAAFSDINKEIKVVTCITSSQLYELVLRSFIHTKSASKAVSHCSHQAVGFITERIVPALKSDPTFRYQTLFSQRRNENRQLWHQCRRVLIRL